MDHYGVYYILIELIRLLTSFNNNPKMLVQLIALQMLIFTCNGHIQKINLSLINSLKLT
jgi:hypothetical protein